MSEELTEEKLDSPLVVHKKTDASYEETASEFEMNETHTEESNNTIQRHRFKKEKKKSKKPIIILVIIVVIAAIFAGLYCTGNITFNNSKSTTTTSTTSKSVDNENKYINTIVVKGTYLFVDGEEVQGIEGLQEAIKYEDKSTSRYKIIKEDANADFLNYDVLPLLESNGFYDKSTTITQVQSTGLMAKEEMTTKSSKKSTTKKADSKMKSTTKVTDN